MMEYSADADIRHRLVLGRDEIIEFLRNKGRDVPTSADIFVRVPGGGDWSNTNLDLDQDTSVFVTWKTKVPNFKG